MIEVITHPMVVGAFSAGIVLLFAGWLTLNQDNKKK